MRCGDDRKVRNPGRPTITVDGRYAMPTAVPMVRESR
jgi:hypothetical protein